MPSCHLLLGLSVVEAHSFREQKEREGRFFPQLSPCIGQHRLHSLLVLVVLLLACLVGGVVTSCHCCLSPKCLLILFASPQFLPHLWGTLLLYLFWVIYWGWLYHLASCWIYTGTGSHFHLCCDWHLRLPTPFNSLSTPPKMRGNTVNIFLQD